MSTIEKVLLSVLASVLALSILALCIRFVHRKRRSHLNSSSTSLPQTQIQHPSSISPQYPLPLHQPSDSPPSLSTFTRISSTSPEMINLPSSSSSSSVISFSLARFFSKQSTAATSTNPGRNVYAQKTLSNTPSTRSSLHGYFWDHSRKECAKDGFPVITLTSPTNSETSIRFPSQDDLQVNAPPSPSSPPSSSSSSHPSTLPSHQITTTSYPTLPSFNLKVEGPSTSSSSSSKALQYHPYFLQQSVPQHMLLHPSYSYTKSTSSEKQSSTLSASPGAPTDFPPTYEEAVDSAGPSSSTKAHFSPPSSSSPSLPSSSPSSSSNNGFAMQILHEPGSSSNVVTRTFDIPLDTLSVDPTTQSNIKSGLDSSSTSPYAIPRPSSPNAPLYEESGWRESVLSDNQEDRDSNTDAGIGFNAEDDPLESLSLQRSSMHLDSPPH